MIGIYKITSPTNRVYIGQSINIEYRFKQYRWIKAKSQTRLRNSFLKYGVENHKFEIVCECKKSELHNLETFYQRLYSVTGNMGLNCFLNLESNIDKVVKRSEKYKNEEKIDKYYLDNKHELFIISNIIDDLL